MHRPTASRFMDLAHLQRDGVTLLAQLLERYGGHWSKRDQDAVESSLAAFRERRAAALAPAALRLRRRA